MPALVNLSAQVLYQHTLAYFELMGLEYPEERSGLGRTLARQTDAFAREILARTRWEGPFSRVLSVGLRLLAEVYSRTPLLPSPLPEISAPDPARTIAPRGHRRSSRPPVKRRLKAR